MSAILVWTDGCAPPAEALPARDPSVEVAPRAVLAEPAAESGPELAGCPLFPADNAWNHRVDGDPVDPLSDQYMAGMDAGARHLHPDFGGNGAYGIPFVVVPWWQDKVAITFDIPGESDAGPYPIPPDPPIEGGSDHHILVLQRNTCLLFETWDTRRDGGQWRAGSGARFNLRLNGLRPAGWTSADAAGLPILPGLIRHQEVQAGRIAHALRFTIQHTQRSYVLPARHFASNSKDPALPPMGLRVRLKASFDISGFGPTARVILTALKEYGMFMADNGGDWYITGEANPAWNDAEITQLSTVPASAFEVVAHPPLQP